MRCLQIIIFTFLFLTACTEFLSQDVSNKTISINSPSDSLYIGNNLVTFWWEDDGDIENYRFQLVRPDFENPLSIFDTTLVTSQLDMQLDQGRYFWRIRAENSSSESTYQQRLLIIDQTPPYAPRVINPQDGDTLLSTNFNILIKWQSDDPEIDGQSFSVSDSVYLYEDTSNSTRLLASFFIEHESAKQLDLSSYLNAPVPGQTLAYRWLVKSFDQAGNIKVGEAFTFYLE